MLLNHLGRDIGEIILTHVPIEFCMQMHMLAEMWMFGPAHYCRLCQRLAYYDLPEGPAGPCFDPYPDGITYKDLFTEMSVWFTKVKEDRNMLDRAPSFLTEDSTAMIALMPFLRPYTDSFYKLLSNNSDPYDEEFWTLVMQDKDGAGYLPNAPEHIATNKGLALAAIYTSKEVYYSLLEKFGHLFSEEVKFLMLLAVNCPYVEFETLEVNEARLLSNRSYALEAVGVSGMILKFLCDEFRCDKEIVIAAVGSNPDAFGFASYELKEDKDVVIAAINSDRQSKIQGCFRPHPFTLGSVDLVSICSDKEVVMAAVHQNGEEFEFASDELKGDIEVAIVAVRNNPMSIRHFTGYYGDNIELLIAGIAYHGHYGQRTFIMAEDFAWDNEEFVIASISSGQCDAQCVSSRLSCDIAFIDSLVDEFPEQAMNIANPDVLLQHSDVVVRAVRQNGRAYLGLHKVRPLFGDWRLAVAAMESTPELIPVIMPLHGCNIDLVTHMVIRDGLTLQYADSSLRDNEAVALAAVTQNAMAIRFVSHMSAVSDGLNNNPLIVLAAVKNASPGVVANVFEEVPPDCVQKVMRLLSRP